MGLSTLSEGVLLVEENAAARGGEGTHFIYLSCTMGAGSVAREEGEREEGGATLGLPGFGSTTFSEVSSLSPLIFLKLYIKILNILRLIHYIISTFQYYLKYTMIDIFKICY